MPIACLVDRRRRGKRHELFILRNILIDIVLCVIDRLRFFDDQDRANKEDRKPSFRSAFAGQSVDEPSDHKDQEYAFGYGVTDSQERMPGIAIAIELSLHFRLV
jgi:hypothetical protein